MEKYPKISEAEWQVMKQLWMDHPISANGIVKQLAKTVSWKPKTVKTLINRLVQKKAVGFEKQGRRHLYFPLVAEEEIVREESRSFLNRFFGGTFTPMLASLIENRDLSENEIKELKALLDKVDEQGK